MRKTGKVSLSIYEQGAAAFRACQADRRFGYFLYLPEHFEPAMGREYALCVIIHGSLRTPHVYRDLFKDFAEEHHCVVLAPMFPVGMTDEEDLSSYKFLAAGDVRYDKVLLSMAEEVGVRYGIPTERFLLHGFSGGGHFVHRFFYVHAANVLALSIGAPGMVTLLDENLDWHCGIHGLSELLNAPIAWEAMRRTPVQMVIGEDDTETWEITIHEDNRYWMPGVNDAGVTRLDRLAALRKSFLGAGIEVRYDVVPGVGHSGYQLLGSVETFFAEALRAARSRHTGE